MKRIIICDSGLGGLNIASHCFRDVHAEPCELIYFNAYPAPGFGFNKLPDEFAKEELFREVLKSMQRFKPDRCLIACNTLSIVYESLRKRYQPSFPVEVITEEAVSGMEEALRTDEKSSLLILGTKTTVESDLYREQLILRGISTARIRGLACPGLATMLETDPASPEIELRLRQYAQQALALFERRPEKLQIALCCTHFEFAGKAWQELFSAAFGIPVGVVNPNERMKTDFFAKEFRYLSRIGFASGAREKMVRYFENRVPEIASTLASAQEDPALFVFQKQQ